MNVEDHSKQFLLLLDPHRNTLWRFVRSMVRTHHDAQDVVSETILQALEGFPKLRDEKAFLSFIFTIASRIVKRRNWRSRLFGDYDEEVVAAMPDRSASPEVQADIELLRTALQRLPTKTREAIVMFEINGLSIEEIRVVQGGTASGVKTRLLRGRRQLARILDTRTEESSEVQADDRLQQHSLVHQHTVL